MRLIIPLLIRDAKPEGLQRVFREAADELGQKDFAWEQMARDIVTWATNEIEQFKARSSGAAEGDLPEAALVEAADELFRALDAEEAGHAPR
jgi:hypothetical protein